jgi:hypothetical protein
MTLIVLFAFFVLSLAVGLALAWGSLSLLFWSIGMHGEPPAQRAVNGSMSSVRVPSAS